MGNSKEVKVRKVPTSRSPSLMDPYIFQRYLNGVSRNGRTTSLLLHFHHTEYMSADLAASRAVWELGGWSEEDAVYSCVLSAVSSCDYTLHYFAFVVHGPLVLMSVGKSRLEAVMCDALYIVQDCELSIGGPPAIMKAMIASYFACDSADERRGRLRGR